MRCSWAAGSNESGSGLACDGPCACSCSCTCNEVRALFLEACAFSSPENPKLLGPTHPSCPTAAPRRRTVVNTVTRIHMLEADGSMSPDVDLVVATPWGQALRPFHQQLLAPFTTHEASAGSGPPYWLSLAPSGVASSVG